MLGSLVMCWLKQQVGAYLWLQQDSDEASRMPGRRMKHLWWPAEPHNNALKCVLLLAGGDKAVWVLVHSYCAVSLQQIATAGASSQQLWHMANCVDGMWQPDRMCVLSAGDWELQWVCSLQPCQSSLLKTVIMKMDASSQPFHRPVTPSVNRLRYLNNTTHAQTSGGMWYMEGECQLDEHAVIAAWLVVNAMHHRSCPIT
eukprot:GHRR01022999.1.p1 GENE.GHRR01022999.1~~GHRR01022999.1.p1  ORF type:complete len:200 (+),score=38.90 GHRR01022999.1:175-774(+)